MVTPPAGVQVLARQHAALAPGLVHHEWYTMSGLLTMLWHGDADADRVVVACGGAMGGLLGPADGLYQRLGAALAAAGIATIRVSYRRPNDLPACVEDLLIVAATAARQGARRVVTVGHSFGGAVAVQGGVAMGATCAGVVTLSTQSAGCEQADRLGDTPLLLLHGAADRILPPQASEAVHALAGGRGELVILPGTDHLLAEAGAEVEQRLLDWIPRRFTPGPGP
jgi:alpha-beta hydrolase superfamily lysophospholipase